MSFCETCRMAAQEEGGTGIEEEVLAEFGADIADHLCDAVEDPGGDPCDCAGH